MVWFRVETSKVRVNRNTVWVRTLWVPSSCYSISGDTITVMTTKSCNCFCMTPSSLNKMTYAARVETTYSHVHTILIVSNMQDAAVTTWTMQPRELVWTEHNDHLPGTLKFTNFSTHYKCVAKTVAWWLKPGFHYHTRVDGWPVSITHQHGPCWRARFH